MTPKTRKDGQLPTDGSNDNNNSVNANGGNDMNEVNTVNPNQRILEVGQPNGPETESPDLIQQFARMLSDPENETAKALMAMFKAAMARNQPTMEVSVNVNVNSGQSSGHPNSVTEMPSSQVFDNPTFETIFTGINRITLGNQNSGQNQSFYQNLPTTIPMGIGVGNNGNNIPNPYNIGIGGQNPNANLNRNDYRNVPNMAIVDPNMYGYDPPPVLNQNGRRHDMRPDIPSDDQEPSFNEKIAFYLYWLNKYLLCVSGVKITKEYISLAICLAQDTKLALAPFVLGTLYKGRWSFVQSKITSNCGGPFWILVCSISVIFLFPGD